jgi:hypothetical protein
MPGITAEQYYKDQGNINVSAGDIQRELYDPSSLDLETEYFPIGLEDALIFPLSFPQVFQKKMMTIDQVRFGSHREQPNESIIFNPNAQQQQSQVEDLDIFKLKYWKKNEEALLFLRDEQNQLSCCLDLLELCSMEKIAIRGFIVRASKDSEDQEYVVR